MELYIDNKRVDTYEDMPVSVSLSVALVSEPEYGRTGYSHSITVPMTPSNRAVLGNCEQVHARERFNSELHTARIESCGALIMEGTIILTGCNCMPGGGGSYTFDIIGSGSEWVRHTSARGISTLFPGWEVVISAATIWDSWTQDDALVRFLPVQRDGYERYNSSPSIMPGERVLTSSDYHPFINVRKVLERLFSEAGYSVRSDFIAGEWFGKLFMSGNYPARDVTVLKKRMDFLASRFGEARATADSFGRVYADPDVDFNTIGNIVDTADPKEESGGVVLEKVYSNGNCFRKEDGQVVFEPLYDISLGFEYRLKYVTDYRIRSATELSGFNIIHLGNDDVRRFKITNRFEDRKNEFCAGKIFRCVVTAGAGDAVYRLVARKLIKAGADPDHLSPGDYETVVIGGFTGSTGFVNPLTD